MFLFKHYRSLKKISITGIILTGMLYGISSTVIADDSLTIALGKKVSQESATAMDISITPDGDNLPQGSGTAVQGKKVFAVKCASCHGEDGKGGEGLADPLIGGIGTLNTNAPVKTVGSFWPYTSTLFDYVRRAMPLNEPQSLSNDEVYAVSAFILSENGIIKPDAIMNAKTLPKVKMPNRDGFVSKWADYKHNP
jgi:cytochrome c